AVAAMASSVAALLLMAVAVLGVSYAHVQEALRDKTEALEREQQSLYFQLIATAAQQLDAQNLGRAEELLDECPPHLRGWEWHYLKRLRDVPPRPLSLGGRWSKAGSASDLAFSPDGYFLAAAGGMEVKVWEPATGREVFSLPGH